MTGVPASSHGSGGSQATEIGYDQITATVNVVSTTEATGTTIISAAAHTFDGAPVIYEVYSKSDTITISPTRPPTVTASEASTQIARLAAFDNPTTNTMIVPLYARYRFTPAAGSHTYTVTAHTTSTTGTPSITAGAGGTGTPAPAFVRFVKV